MLAVLMSPKVVPEAYLAPLETPPLRMATCSPVVGKYLKVRSVEREQGFL